jgi:hypothetical protein
MAATYPLDVVEVARRSALRGAATAEWDASVKSLALFPSVLDMVRSRRSDADPG